MQARDLHNSKGGIPHKKLEGLSMANRMTNEARDDVGTKALLCGESE